LAFSGQSVKTNRAESPGEREWSVILAAGQSRIEAESSRAALAQLCESYWPPL